MLSKMKLISLILLGSLSLVACGQKGPLYKAPEVEDNQPQQDNSDKVEQASQKNKE
ncbi:LPS translocon maturation chaperone LptM [Shewanella colwelliana]|uniref:LPS translocon maturation chaperone LptM n=1 Tax=Shewanella colwelliana TaxID=23 RepID=UPI000A638FFB|nr:lipoprotein [Shewanella colwelliana]